MEFQVNDVVQHQGGGARYRIHAIVDEGYKARRLDNGAIVVLPFSIDERYVTTDPPDDEFAYYPGQVLLKKQGSPRIGLITEVVPGVDNDRHLYHVAIFNPQGQNERRITCSQKELLAQYEIRNLKWIILHGDPRKIVRQALQKEREALLQELYNVEEALKNLVYFETEIENAAD